MVSISEVSARSEFIAARQCFEQTGETEKLERFMRESEIIPSEAREFIAHFLAGRVQRPKKPMARNHQIMEARKIFDTHVRESRLVLEGLSRLPDLKGRNLKKITQVREADFDQFLMNEFGYANPFTARAAYKRAVIQLEK